MVMDRIITRAPLASSATTLLSYGKEAFEDLTKYHIKVYKDLTAYAYGSYNHARALGAPSATTLLSYGKEAFFPPINSVLQFFSEGF